MGNELGMNCCARGHDPSVARAAALAAGGGPEGILAAQRIIQLQKAPVEEEASRTDIAEGNTSPCKPQCKTCKKFHDIAQIYPGDPRFNEVGTCHCHKCHNEKADGEYRASLSLLSADEVMKTVVVRSESEYLGETSESLDLQFGSALSMKAHARPEAARVLRATVASDANDANEALMLEQQFDDQMLDGDKSMSAAEVRDMQKHATEVSMKAGLAVTVFAAKAARAADMRRAEVAAIVDAPERAALEEAARRAQDGPGPRISTGEDPFASCYAAKGPSADVGVAPIAQALNKMTLGGDDSETRRASSACTRKSVRFSDVAPPDENAFAQWAADTAAAGLGPADNGSRAATSFAAEASHMLTIGSDDSTRLKSNPIDAPPDQDPFASWEASSRE